MHYEKVKCEYCGRVNLTSDLDCRGCGAGIMSDPIKHDDGTRTWKTSNDLISVLWSTTDAALSSDGGGFTFGSTEPYPHNWSSS